MIGHVRTRVWLFALVMAASAGTLLLAQGFNVRTGAWQYLLDMSKAMPTEGLPPEALAQLQAQFKKPQVAEGCITAEDLKQMRLGRMNDDDGEDSCKVLSAKTTATTADITRQCSGGEAYVETMHVDAPTPQTFKATITRKAGQRTTTMTMTAKWVAAKCKE
jgi:hypothetical protein